MEYTIFDIETDGLLETVSIIHCISYLKVTEEGKVFKGSITEYPKMISFLKVQKVLVGHNIINYDIPVLKKLLKINIESRLIDTLGLSWYLYPTKIKHGLEIWGEELGVKKPVILDWSNLKIEEYINRCESDVEINNLLFSKQLKYLEEIYIEEPSKIHSIINYISFKLDCIRKQYVNKCKLDVNLVNKSLKELEDLKREKVINLINSMPKNIHFKEVNKPAKMYKKDDTLSKRGEYWLLLLETLNLPINTEGPIIIKDYEEEGNPSSNIQIKNWLYSLGWEPITFEHRKNTEGEVKAIPQIYSKAGVCESIKRLYEIEPALENLDMLSLINHRIGVFKGYLSSLDNKGYVTAQMHGLTNTLRFRHKKPIANLPKVFKFYGEQIRGAIISPSSEHFLCGADMTSLEDSTKQHYMYFFDPEYVTQMRVPGFDPHLDIAVLSGLLTKEQAEAHKVGSEDHSITRGIAKVINFSGIYGAGPPKIAQSSGMSLQQARILHKIYWKRNKAVKLVEKSCKVRTIGYQMWLYNPVSGFWYSLRYLKDRFSTLNQGTGVYVFDLWVREIRSRGIKINLQYHDEIVTSTLKINKEKVKKILEEAISKINRQLKLNVPLGIDVQFGINYAKIH